MSMSFSLVPTGVLQPLFYAEVNSSKAQSGTTPRPSLLVGQKLPSGTATVHVPVRVSSGSQADGYFGFGSQLARMCRSYLANDPYAELWCIPVADAGGAVKATSVATLALTGPATAAGTLNIYIGGQKLAIAVASGDTADAIGVKIQAALGVDEAAAVTAKSQFPVTAVNTAGSVVLTARNGGTGGNQIDLRLNYLGPEGGETTPAGVGCTITPLASGATNPTLTSAITAMGDKRYSFVGHPWGSDATILDAFQAEFADSTAGRWGPMRRVYGHVFSADVNTYTVLSTTGYATAKNQDPHHSTFGIEASPTPPWEIAGAYCARAAQSLRNDPARPLNTLELIGVLAPAETDRFNWAEREVLLNLGMTTPLITSDNKVCIQRAVTNRTKNSLGSTDHAYIDVTTPATLDYMLTEMESLITTKYSRVKLVNDSAQVAPGQAVATASMVKADLVAQYRGWERNALAENSATFAKLIVVERNEADANRLDVLFPPDLANGLHIFAALAEFRTQYSDAEIAAA